MPASIKNITQYIPQSAKVEWHDTTAVFEVAPSDIQKIANDFYHEKHLPLKMITATDERKEHGCFKIWYVFGVPKENIFLVPFIVLKNTETFPSLATTIHEAANHERKIQTFFGLTPKGHPDTRPIILHENWPIDVFPLRKDFDGNPPREAHGQYNFQKVDGEGIYEIPVGPIHAGIIEPGHFRFSVAGEEIMLLEARLGFVHKGSEKLFERLSLTDQVRLSEKISGDSSFSHSLAFCQAVEQLAGIHVSEHTRFLRVIYAELERLANHCGDIAFIMLDTGFNFGGSQGTRLREMVMRVNERLTGSRFLRGVNGVGGITKDIHATESDGLSRELIVLRKDFSEIIAIAENSSSLRNRLEDTGILSSDIAKDCGVVGVAGRAIGMVNDARVDYPYAAYTTLHIGDVATEKKGDAQARFRVRVKEVHASIALIVDALRQLPEERVTQPVKEVTLKKNAVAVSIVEGWRGDIVYFVATDAHGAITRVAPRDPSFLNWSAVGHAGVGNMVPDFPLINKSFNLSYSGNDL
ncbi:MAG: NADH-quinone oxidoreductase subunit C [bacterium]|nr:NADH-quinone oxidoreductase subunit C [bacterium]